MPDIEGKSSRKRYLGKLAHLLAQGWDITKARLKAAGYAGGKTVPTRPGPHLQEGGTAAVPYATLADLPEFVRTVLPEAAQEVWMKAFNESATEGKPEQDAGAKAWSAVRQAGFELGSDGIWIKAAEPPQTTFRFASSKELSHEQVRERVYGALRTSGILTECWIREMYDDHAIVEDYAYDGMRYYRVDYTLTAEGVDLGQISEVELQISYVAKASEAGRVLGVIALAEEEEAEPPDVSEIEILRTGEWNHPEYGKIKVTEADLDLFITNFDNKVRGVDLAVDQGHRPDEGAAGWFKALFKQETDHGPALFARIEWTPLGKDLIAGKIFRYISPEFAFLYKDDETGKQTKNVLYGAALTNRPFIKGMQPVLMSEEMAVKLTAEEIAALAQRFFFAEPATKAGNPQDPASKGGATVNLTEIAKALGLAETADEAAINAALAQLKTRAEGAAMLAEIRTALNLSETATASAMVQAIKEMAGKAAVATSKDAEIVTLKEDNTRLSERITALELQNRRNQWEARKTKLLNEGKLVPNQVPLFEERYMRDPESTEQILAVLQPVVSMGEAGSARDIDSHLKLFEQKIAEKMQANQGMAYGDAVIEVAREHPALYQEVKRQRKGA